MLLALLAACVTLPVKDGCADLVPPPVAACFGGGTLTWEGYGALSANPEGTIVSIGRGARPDACLVDVGNGTVGEGLVIVIEDADGLSWTVSVDVPDLADTFLAVGDYVYVSADYTFGEYGPDTGVVALTDLDGNIRLILEEAGSIDTLPVPHVEVTEGETRCTEDDGCGVFSKYDIGVAVGSRSATVPYGEEVDLDGLRVVHGGYERQAEDQGDTCPDWFVANVTLAVVDDVVGD